MGSVKRPDGFLTGTGFFTVNGSLLNSGFLPINFSSNYRKPETNITLEKLEEFIEEIKIYIKEIWDAHFDSEIEMNSDQGSKPLNKKN